MLSSWIIRCTMIIFAYGGFEQAANLHAKKPKFVAKTSTEKLGKLVNFSARMGIRLTLKRYYHCRFFVTNDLQKTHQSRL